MFEREDDRDMVFFGVTGEAGVDLEVTELGLLREVREMTERDLMGLGGSIGSDGMDGPEQVRTHARLATVRLSEPPPPRPTHRYCRPR
jgi:hypothetical protein